MPNFYEKVKFFADFLITHKLKKGIHPRPCGMINLSNIISYGRGTLPQLIECFDSSNDECMEFSRQQLHINITLLDVLIFSMDFFIRNDIEAKKTAKDIEEKKQTVEVAKTLRQKIVSMLLPDPWFGESADIQRATYSCYEMINGWG